MLAPVKNNVRVGVLLFLGVICSAHVFAQSDQPPVVKVPQPTSPFAIEAGGELIYPLSNQALRDNFGGVYSVHASGVTKLYKRFYGGFELQNFQVSEVTPVTFRIAIATTNEFFYNAGLKVGYYSSEENTWCFSGSLVVGKSLIIFNDVPGITGVPGPAGGYKKEATFFSPRICESIKVDEGLSIGLEITYTYVGYKFDPLYVNLLSQTYSPGGPSTFLGWGFNVNYFLGKPKA